MRKSTLIELLYKFSPDEHKKFESFLKSPYHNNHASPLKLFLEIKKFAPEYSSGKLDKEQVWKNIFPGKKFNYGVMKNLIHELTKLGMKFLTIEHLERDEIYKDDFLATELFLRNCKKLYPEKIKQIDRKYSGNFLKRHQLEAEKFYKFQSRMFQQKEYFEKMNKIKSPEEKDLQGSSYITFAYIIFLVIELNNIVASSYDKNYNTENNLTIYLMKNFNEGFFSKVLEIAKHYPDKDYRVMDTYISLGKALLDLGNEELYHRYKKKLLQNRSLFPGHELKSLFTCLSTVLSHSSKNVLTETIDNFDYMAELKYYRRKRHTRPELLLLLYNRGIFYTQFRKDRIVFKEVYR